MSRITYSVLYGPYKPYKKHKEWKFDGTLVVFNWVATLEDNESGKTLGTIPVTSKDLFEDNTLVFGNYECLIGEEVVHANVKPSPIVEPRQVMKPIPVPVIPGMKAVGKRSFISPMMSNSANFESKIPKLSNVVSKFTENNCYKLPRPPTGYLGIKEEDVVDVYLTANLTKVCLPHQLEGISFMYQCVMGYKDTLSSAPINGAILADEMGLGKTLQCIALIYTLSRSGPAGKPVISNSLILVPSSLVDNWKKEFKRWIGDERLRVYIANKDNSLADYVKYVGSGKSYKALVVSYDTFLQQYEKICNLKNVKFDLMLCDEGHRLKNTKMKLYDLLNQLNISRRVVLTGTPVQNDLEELYALASFVNPGIFGKYSKFQRCYEKPIMHSMEKHTSSSDAEHGQQQSSELTSILNTFTLRRTNEEISKYLPPKTEYVICCRPTKVQREVYQDVLSSGDVTRLLKGFKMNGDCTFSFINQMRKVCNHPFLLSVDDGDTGAKENLMTDKKKLEKFNREQFQNSAKFVVVRDILRHMKNNTKERIVLVANYTKTLDLLQKMCEIENYPFCRLDGSTSSGKRQEIVDAFNNVHTQTFVFLLSTKAGGVGLNLIGGSRLLLFDLDWNPAHDKQAMARIWRRGQKLPVHIYRLLTTGTIEERIFQRQMKKEGLSTELVDNKSDSIKFSTDELKDLFSFANESTSTTHDMLSCECNLRKSTAPDEAAKENDGVSSKRGMAELESWDHLSGDKLQMLKEDGVVSELTDNISFAFRNKVNFKIASDDGK
ncbi:DNA repair and recombination protein RAD54B [Halotydeus destructor]|nr:DNA repair and recombination protein RAD54B [Halotydeus destructor]